MLYLPFGQKTKPTTSLSLGHGSFWPANVSLFQFAFMFDFSWRDGPWPLQAGPYGPITHKDGCFEWGHGKLALKTGSRGQECPFSGRRVTRGLYYDLIIMIITMILEILSCCNLTFYMLEPVFNWKIRAQSLIYFISVCLSSTTLDFSLFLSHETAGLNLIFSLWHSNISQAANCQTILCHFTKFLCFYLFMFCNYAFCWTPYSKLIFPLGTVKSWSWALLVIPWVLHWWS